MLAALLLAGAATTASGAAPVVVAPLRSTVPPSMEIGKRSAGWTCFPAGAIRWRDLMFEQNAAAETVARSLSSRGVSASTDQETGGSTVLAGTIRSVEASACFPQHALGKLIGGKTKLKGHIVLMVSWTARRPDATVAGFETRSEVDASLRDPDLQALLEAGLTQVSVDAARELQRLPAG